MEIIFLFRHHCYHFQSHFFDRNDVALDKISNYFKKASHEERGHAEQMMRYHNKRGGISVFSQIDVITMNHKF